MEGLTARPKGDLEETWTIQVDGSTNRNASEAGMVLNNQMGYRMEHSIHFTFPATNNVAEYEALLEGVRVADTIDIIKVKMSHTLN